ncbi:hypothetical protein [Streptomyces roseolilacinus]|uniref:hypothetical protein n=1 Tax=Streptomyces roseolilacinus TaxID=66904 RepID=UPI00381AE7E3
MCVVEAAAEEAAVIRFLRTHPQAGRAGRDHPALQGCAEASWARIPGCPAGIPALFQGLLDPAVGPEALRLLGNVLLDGVFHLGAAMPTALPFLIRLAADPGIAVRSGLVDLVVVAAELSRPVDADDARAVLLFGDDGDHPERERCRAVFVEQASALRALLDDETLPDGLIGADDRDRLRDAMTPR